MVASIEDQLDEAIDRLLRGEELDATLQHCALPPESLRALLDTVLALRAMSAPPARDEAYRRGLKASARSFGANRTDSSKPIDSTREAECAGQSPLFRRHTV